MKYAVVTILNIICGLTLYAQNANDSIYNLYIKSQLTASKGFRSIDIGVTSKKVMITPKTIYVYDSFYNEYIIIDSSNQMETKLDLDLMIFTKYNAANLFKYDSTKNNEIALGDSLNICDLRCRRQTYRIPSEYKLKIIDSWTTSEIKLSKPISYFVKNYYALAEIGEIPMARKFFYRKIDDVIGSSDSYCEEEYVTKIDTGQMAKDAQYTEKMELVETIKKMKYVNVTEYESSVKKKNDAKDKAHIKSRKVKREIIVTEDEWDY